MPANLHLSSEALKAIFAFMTREQLMELSEVNRQFYSAINTPPFVAKPLLHVYRIFYEGKRRSRNSEVVVLRSTTMDYRQVKRFYGIDALISFLEQQWIRFAGELVAA